MLGLAQSRLNRRGLLARWTFDNGTGMDSSGLGLAGVLQNGPIPAPGIVKADGIPGNALKFDGSNDYVISNALVNIALVTMSIWVKINGNPGAQSLICGFVNGIGSGTADKSVLCKTDGTVAWYVYDGGAKTATGTTVVTNNQWHHIVCVADGTNAILYIDGKQDGTVAAGNTYAGYSVPNVLVNGAQGGVAATYLACEEDDFQLYNRGISPIEVGEIYNEVVSAKFEFDVPAFFVAAGGFFSRYYYDMRRAA